MEIARDPTPEEVADLLGEVARANALVATELKAITDGQLAVSQAMLDRLSGVVTKVRPAAEARARLGALSPALLLGGAQVWRARALPGLARGRL